MSTNWVLVIPTDPAWVPAREAASAALERFRELVPLRARSAAAIQAQTLEEIQFVDPGGNWEHVRCPFCSTGIDAGWWGERMEAAYATKFTQLGAVTPCCEKLTSLNDLRYDWPAGLARFILSAEDPERGWLTAEELNAVATALGHPVRQTLRHI
ncbi:MAG TPA: hypothetical protein VH916_03895 [Dehalococcoidia bacterium]|jgi:hypothetical protein